MSKRSVVKFFPNKTFFRIGQDYNFIFYPSDFQIDSLWFNNNFFFLISIWFFQLRNCTWKKCVNNNISKYLDLGILITYNYIIKRWIIKFLLHFDTWYSIFCFCEARCLQYRNTRCAWSKANQYPTKNVWI